MRFNFSGEWQTSDIARLCIPDQKLYTEYKKKHTIKNVVLIAVSAIWMIFVFVFGTLYPEGAVDDTLAIVILASIGVCVVAIAVLEIIWFIQRGRIFAQAERLLPQDELGRLKRRLIGHLRAYYKVFTPVVAVVALVILGVVALIEYFLGDTLMGGILMVSTVVIPLAPLIIFLFRFTRERKQIIEAINKLSDEKIDIDELDDLDDLNL